MYKITSKLCKYPKVQKVVDKVKKWWYNNKAVEREWSREETNDLEGLKFFSESSWQRLGDMI